MAISPVSISRSPSRSAQSVRIWDLPTRVFHWVLAATIFGAILTVKLGGNWMDWHTRLGTAALALLSFRIVWGIVGSRYARFASFLYSPKTAWAYLRPTRGEPIKHYAGHNPAGAASVFILLLTLLLQVLTGLFSSDSISVEGPWAKYLSEEHVSLATTIHHWMEWPLYALIGLHIGAVFFYLLAKKENLIRPMLTGDKHLPGARPAKDTWLVRLAGLGLLGTAMASAIWFLR
jgi:cytochrome b